MNNLKRLLLEKVPYPARSVLLYFLLLAFLVTGGALGLGLYALPTLERVRQDIGTLKTTNNRVEGKLAFLQNVSQETRVLESTGPLALAVPQESPVYLSISQIKKIASGASVQIVSFKVVGVEGDTKSRFSLETEGPFEAVLQFINSLINSSPLSVIDKVEVTTVEGIARATFSYSLIWQPFPASLPSFDEPLANLTDKERETLNRLLSLSQPDFTISELETSTIPRSNPFSP